MNEPTLRRSTTHASDNCQGSVLGIEVPMFLWLALALLAGVGLFVWLYFAREAEFFTALSWAALPPGAAVIYLRVFHQGRAPGHFFDWLETRLGHGHATPPTHEPPHPLHDL